MEASLGSLMAVGSEIWSALGKDGEMHSGSLPSHLSHCQLNLPRQDGEEEASGNTGEPERQ